MARDGDSRREKRRERGESEEKDERITRRDSKTPPKSKRHADESGISDGRDSDSSTETEEHSSASSSEEELDRKRHRKIRRKSKSSRRRYSDSESGSSESESESETEEERRRRKRKERKRREEREKEKRRRREKEKKRKKRRGDDSDDDDDDEERRRKRKKKEKREKEEKKKKKGKTGAVTNSWGKYGIVREVDMWNKRPEFTAWLAEVKQVNLESIPNRDEKIMFKEYMEDYNTATFPSKKYYDLDAYHRRKMEKEMKKGFKKVSEKERIVFNDEEQRRLELLQVREKQKEQEVEALKEAMKTGKAQAMKEQVRLKEEMVYLYKIGNIEAAAAIQRRLDPDLAM